VPAKQDAIAREKVAQIMTGEVEAMADDGDRRHRRLQDSLLQIADARGHRAHQFRIEPRARHDQLAKVVIVESSDTRSLGSAQARDRRRPEEQGQFPEKRTVLVVGEDALYSTEGLRDGEPARQQDEEGRSFAFMDQPLAVAQLDIGRAPCNGGKLGCGDLGEKRYVF
jgi:hypothetical protein